MPGSFLFLQEFSCIVLTCLFLWRCDCFSIRCSIFYWDCSIFLILKKSSAYVHTVMEVLLQSLLTMCKTFCFLIWSVITPCPFLRVPPCFSHVLGCVALCGIDHVVVHLSSIDASCKVASVCFCFAWHDMQSRLERLIRTLDLHGSPAGCSRWSHIGFPGHLETALGRIAVLLAGKGL